jgi:DNA-binding response OmpR family regulator
MTTVLVVDDEAPIRLLCRVNLEAEGMRVLEASDGESGLETARTERPDVILLDVMMPGRNGWEVAEELLSDDATSRIPIIFLTARAEVRDRAKGIDLGGVDYVTKPFNPVELAPLVEDLVRRVESGEPAKSAVTMVAREKPSKAPIGVATPIRCRWGSSRIARCVGLEIQWASTEPADMTPLPHARFSANIAPRTWNRDIRPMKLP